MIRVDKEAHDGSTKVDDRAEEEREEKEAEQEGVLVMLAPQPTTNTDELVRAMLLALRDKALADARQNMRMVRAIEQKLGLTPASAKER